MLLPAPSLIPDFSSTQDKHGDLPLHLAARFNHPAMVQLLLEGMPPSWAPKDTLAAANKPGRLTPMHLAAQYGALEAAQALDRVALSLGSDCCEAQKAHTCRLGQTPGQVAARRGHSALAELLCCTAGGARGMRPTHSMCWGADIH